MFAWLSKLGIGKGQAGPAMDAATQLKPVAVPKKLTNKQIASPSYLTTAQPNPDSALPRVDRNLATTNLETLRFGIDSRKVIRDFAASSPDLSASVNAYLRTAITAKYTAVAKDMDGVFNRDATALLQQLLTRFDTVQDYEDGFSGVNSMRSNSESMAKELMLYGACSLELVLGKDRLPRTLQPVSTSQIVFYPDKSGRWMSPKQKVSGQEIDLDIPTFFYTALDQDLLDPYASSPLEPAIQLVLFSTEFMNDLRRIVKKSVHPRLTVKINEEIFRKHMPSEATATPEATATFMNNFIATVESTVNNLNPEDALVYFDSIGVELLNNGNISLDAEYKVLTGIVDAKMTTGAKALPSILGHGSGSQNIASSETLLFMKNAQGAVQEKLNEIYSRALTLALRLFGQDVYVEFRYEPIDLRPDSELEAFKVMRQSRVLEQLSYGFVSDDEASIQITGHLTPAGFKPLSGTQFLKPAPAGADGATPTSNTGPQTNNKKTPEAAKGPQKKADMTSEELRAEIKSAITAALAAVTPLAGTVESAPQITAEQIRDIVAGIAGDVFGLKLDAMSADLKAEIYEVAGAINQDLTEARAAATETQNTVSTLVETQARSETPPPADKPINLHLTVVNEASKHSTKKVGKATRDAEGNLVVTIEEEAGD